MFEESPATDSVVARLTFTVLLAPAAEVPALGCGAGGNVVVVGALVALPPPPLFTETVLGC